MKKNLKRFIPLVLALILSMNILTVSASTSNPDIETTATINYPNIASATLSPGAGNREVTLSIPSGKTARQIGIAGGLNGGGIPAGSMGTLVIGSNEYMFEMGTLTVFNLPALSQATGPAKMYVKIKPNDQNTTWHYAVLVYGN